PHRPALHLHAYLPHPDLHSFPTRRSSDLDPVTRTACGGSIQFELTHCRASAFSGPAKRDRGALARGCLRWIVQEMRSGNRCGLRSEEHTSELQSRFDLVCRLLLEKKNTKI